MSDLYEECKKWISWLQKLNLDNIIESLKNIQIFKQNEDCNKYLFKLLLHLSHCADRCHRDKLSKETEIFTIAKIICENLIKVQDKGKLYSAIYYIAFYLLNRKLFNEAKVISAYLFPGAILDNNDYLDSQKYNQMGSLWLTEISKKLDLLIANGKRDELIDKELCSYVYFNFQILKFSDENLCSIFKAIDVYIKKLANFTFDAAFPCLVELFQSFSNHISMLNLKKLPVEEAYNRMISMFGFALYKRNDIKNNSKMLQFFRQLDSYMIKSMKDSSECINCYRLFRDYSLNLFETNFMSNEIGEARIKKCFETLEFIVNRYGCENNSVMETITAITYSFDILFTNWENLVLKQLANTNISKSDILKMGDFMKNVHNVLKKRSFPQNYTCKKCPESVKCSMKKDIFNASIALNSYIRVITKFNTDNLDESIFLIAKELVEEMILTFNELEKAGCKNSKIMWDLCGRSIFNIGLISETKYPAELEGLYEVLCKQIVLRDGLNSKVSSFGLENPVGTTLHRLHNANFNQEKYRKAMSFTAYNALFSNNEARKKKAYDSWTNIKLKLIDSKEIQELTILKCLETDKEEIKKLGIKVNLKDYDLSDMCLRELKSLYQVKANMILSIKKTLAELESMKNGLHYAQGVLLLCCHAMQLNKREYISDHITKAIEKLKNHKPKTSASQCLLANLNFFAIIEKLFARSQAINKQMDNAKFTIKAFKALKGKRLEDDNDDEEETVPTYGGINIEEDKKCSNEIRDVVTMWENYMQKDIMAIVNDWEPKTTLEIIIICSEYCRLYKFDLIEEKCWKLAYKLATALQDFPTCIYVISRSISLRCISDTWINDAEKYVESIKDSTKNTDLDLIALFWLSLADFYFDCRMVEKAKELMDKVQTLPNYEILANSKIYLYATYIQFRNYSTIYEKASQEEYIEFLVKIHYSMINLNEIITQSICKFLSVKFQLFAYEQVFEVMSGIVIPMNSLLSYREITAHLTCGLKLAQKLGMTLRIGQYLKYFCYIDLLRTHTEDCETKLQDLEHILCLEQFQMSIKNKLQEKSTSTQATTKRTQVVRGDGTDVPINFSKDKSSPDLKKKLFSKPNFIEHTVYCQCFTCANLHYQYLCFSCSHIRAQLYSLLKYKMEADQYFNGAFAIKLKIDERDSVTARQHKNYKWKGNQNFAFDSLLLMLDFSLFIIDFKIEHKDYALLLIEKILEDCKENDLSKYYFSVFANEIYFEHFIYNVFQNDLCISAPADIPITITNQPVGGCITPKQQIEKVVQRPRRRKSPPAIAVPAITIDGLSDQENNSGDSPTPKHEPVAITKKPKRPTRARSVRRKILLDEGEESPTLQEEPITTRKSTRLSKKAPN